MAKTSNLRPIAKHAVTYAITIFITGSVAFVAILVMKRRLDATDFASHNIIFNTMLIANIVLQGWLTQGLLRYGHSYLQQKGIGRHFLRLALLPMLIAVLVNAIIGYALNLPWLVMAFFLPTVAISSLLYVLLAYCQAQLWSHFMLQSELLRSIFFLGLLFCPLVFKFEPTIAWYWASWFMAYLASCLLLLAQIKLKTPSAFFKVAIVETKIMGKKLFVFGWPLCIFLGGIFLLATMDRYFLTLHFNRALLANYLALSEVVVKGMGFLLSPALMAVYPIASKQYDELGNGAKNLPMMRKILVLYACVIFISAIIYLWLYRLLAGILQLPMADTPLYYSGLILLLASGIWQWNTLLHKPLELAQKTHKLSTAILLATIFCLVLQWLLVPKGFILAASGSFLAGVLLYTLIIGYYLKKEGKGKIEATI